MAAFHDDDDDVRDVRDDVCDGDADDNCDCVDNYYCSNPVERFIS